jgi:Inosine-uridine preferring nucleoside hydrolase
MLDADMALLMSGKQNRACIIYWRAACCNNCSHAASDMSRQVTVLALGPLTNLALALQLDPDFATNVVRVARDAVLHSACLS